MLTLRLYFRRHFKAATSVPPLDHVRVRPGAGCALRANFFIFLFFLFDVRPQAAIHSRKLFLLAEVTFGMGVPRKLQKITEICKR